MKLTILPYETLTNSFVQGQLSATKFETEFLKLFEYDNTDFTEEEYKILNTLFWAVENFCSHPELRDDGDLDEIQLREAAKVALKSLEATEQSFTIQVKPDFEISEELEKRLSSIIGKQLECILPQVLEKVLSKKLEEISLNKTLFDNSKLTSQ
ncbi:MAG: colicin immunity domain-containing protein [Pseudomonadota bacterium]